MNFKKGKYIVIITKDTIHIFQYNDSRYRIYLIQKKRHEYDILTYEKNVDNIPLNC